jgi:hypothetical protein
MPLGPICASQIFEGRAHSRGDPFLTAYQPAQLALCHLGWVAIAANQKFPANVLLTECAQVMRSSSLATRNGIELSRKRRKRGLHR